MESPKKVSGKETKTLPSVSTPKHLNSRMNQEPFCLYGLHRECSPNAYTCSQDTLEIGWGDSPEPLKRIFPPDTTPVACKRKLEPKESPRSSNSYKNRRIRPSFKPPPKPAVDVSRYVAELQELSKNILKEKKCKEGSGVDNNVMKNINTSETVTKQSSPTIILKGEVSNLLKDDDSLNECLIACTQSVEMNLQKETNGLSPIPIQKAGIVQLFHGETLAKKERTEISTPKKPQKICIKPSDVPIKDSSFDKVLQSFISDDDDWLSQVVVNQEPKQTPRKGNFVKSRSDNQLVSPCVEKAVPNLVNKNVPKVLNNSFRRSCSFDISNNIENSKVGSTKDIPKKNINVKQNRVDESIQPLKKQKSFTAEPINKIPGTQCTFEEIERKRLEAKFRKERKEIERKKLEALRKQEMRKLGVRTVSQTNFAKY